MICPSDSELESIVLDTAGSFNFGSPIVIDDIRFAAKVDGYDLSKIEGHIIAGILKNRCIPIRNPGYPKDRVSWIRKW